jgi:hypothetical protein
MFARWSQENFFRDMRQHFGLDRLVEYGTESIPDTVRTVNPVWRQLDSQVRSLKGQRQRSLAIFAARSLEGEPSDTEVTGYRRNRPNCRSTLNTWGNKSSSSSSSARKLLITSEWRSCRKANAFSVSSANGSSSWTPSN